jgi:hypothetical protein
MRIELRFASHLHQKGTGQSMRYAVSLAVICILILCQLCCKRVDSFEAVFEGTTKDKMGSGLMSIPGLSARTTGKVKSCQIVLETQTNATNASGVPPFGEMQLIASMGDDPWVAPWVWVISDQMNSNGLRLNGSDLRVGQRIRVTYSLKRKYRDVARVELLNYSKPLKVLLVSMSMVLEGGFKNFVSPESVEAIVITALSWRLPSDVALVKSTANTAGLTPIGELKITYKLIQSETGLMFRAYEFSETLDVDTKLADPTPSTNWAQLRIVGGTRPGNTSDVNDTIRTPVLTNVPSFEVYPALLKKK